MTTAATSPREMIAFIEPPRREVESPSVKESPPRTFGQPPILPGSGSPGKGISLPASLHLTPMPCYVTNPPGGDCIFPRIG